MMRRLELTLAASIALLVARPAAAEWREASSEHFIIYADSNETWLRGFADRLERYDAALRHIRGMTTPTGAASNRLTIYVVSSIDAVARLCGAGCGNVAGFYVPRAGGSVAYTPRLPGGSDDPFNADVVLFHEYAHHLMLENFAAAYPRWFVEGFAEFNGTAKILPGGAVQIGAPAQHRAYALLLANPLPIATLLDSSKARLNDEQIEVFYGRAWLLTHMLMFDPARKGQLTNYLKLINEGKPNLVAAQAAFGDLKVLAKDMDRYLARSKISALTLDPALIKVAPIAVRPLGAGEAATMAVRMRSDRGVGRTAAALIVRDARKRASDYPNDPAAQLVLAEAEYDAGNDAACEAAADRALAVDAKNRGALLYKGQARLRLAAIAKTTDPKVWREARSWIVKANRLDPDAAEPLMLYYESFLTADEKPSNVAIDGLYRAFQLSPHDTGLRLMLVHRMLLDDKPKDARQVLLPLAYDPHASADNPALKMIGLIDSGMTGTAIVAAGDKADADAAANAKAGSGKAGAKGAGGKKGD